MADELDLTAIRTFLAVVDAGDLTAAARSLRVTRSAVGKALTRLETSLGVRLLHRTTRQVAMTSDGAVFHEHCLRIMGDLSEARHAVRQSRQAPLGVLRFSVPDAYGRHRLLPILRDFMRRWPAVGVEVRFSDRFDNIVEDGLDLAFRTGVGDAGSGLVTRVVDRFRGVLCASPDYLAARGAPDGAAALEGHDLLLFGQRDRIRPWPLALPARGSRPRSRNVFDSADALRSAALAGLGIAHLPDFLVSSDVEAALLVVLDIHPPDVVDVRALYPDPRLLPARARLFVDMVVEARF